MKQTAVEWLINELTVIDFTDPFWKEKIEQAKEMEKQQIINAINYFGITGLGYYQKTFNKI